MRNTIYVIILNTINMIGLGEYYAIT